MRIFGPSRNLKLYTKLFKYLLRRSSSLFYWIFKDLFGSRKNHFERLLYL